MAIMKPLKDKNRLRSVIRLTLGLSLIIAPAIVSARIYTEILFFYPSPSGSWSNYGGRLLGWDTNDATANPCVPHANTSCFIGPAFKQIDLQGRVITVWANKGVLSSRDANDIVKVKTMGELGKIYLQHFPASSQFDGQINDPPKTVCLGMAWSYSTSSYVQGFLPGSLCSIAPTPMQRCEFVESSLDLSHGTLSANNVSGNTANGYLSVKCTYAQKLMLSMMINPDSRLQLGSGIWSTLTVNGTPAYRGYTFTTADGIASRVNITSELGTYGTATAGSYSASTVAILAIP